MFSLLWRAVQSPWKFMAETIMNLSKILEVLFTPSGETPTMGAARGPYPIPVSPISAEPMHL
jgi:hypothetical protein